MTSNIYQLESCKTSVKTKGGQKVGISQKEKKKHISNNKNTTLHLDEESRRVSDVDPSGHSVPYVNLKGKSGATAVMQEIDEPFDYDQPTTVRRGMGGRMSIKRAATAYLNSMARNLATTTVEGQRRRYNRIDREMEMLYKEGRIDHLAPTQLSPEDIHNYIAYRTNLGLSKGEIQHDISSLSILQTYIDNDSMDYESWIITMSKIN